MKRLASLFVVLALVPLAPAGEDKATVKEGPITVPFELLKTQHMAVTVKINGEGPFRLIFDTGAPFTLLNNKTAKAVGLIAKDAKGGSAPLFPGMGYKAKTLELGGVKATDVPLMVMDHPLVTLMSKHVGGVEGILGLSFFARYKMTIDYQTKEMTFTPSTFEPKDAMSNMMGMMMGSGGKAKAKVLAPAGQWGFTVGKDKADEDAGVLVKVVLPGGAADSAGIKAGDRLLTLDGHWTDSVNDAYHAAAAVRPGTPARVVVRRDGKEIELTVNVRPGL